MKKMSLILAGILALNFAHAAQIVQTFQTDAFVPGIDTTHVFNFSQFDTLGGLRTLTSVTITLEQSVWGGYYSVDNDSATTADISAQHGASGKLSVHAGDEYFLPTGSGTTVYTVMSSGAIQLAATTGDDVGVFNAGGEADKYSLVGPDAGSPLTGSTTGTRTTSLDPYIGTGTLGIDYVANQASSSTQVGGVYYSGGPASEQGLITITYEYTQVPEPTSMALVALGCVAFGLRRRGRSQKKA